MTLKEVFDELNFDYDSLYHRFSNNEALAVRFTKKFLDSPVYAELCNAVETNDYENIETKAHTLKGIAGNLNFSTLFMSSDALVKVVRAKEYQRIPNIFQQLKADYEQVITGIRKLD